MKVVYSGLESSGKSLQLSRLAGKLLKRNKYWNKILTKLGKPCPRTMAFNQPMSKEFIAEIEKAGMTYIQWRDFNEIEHLRDADIFIDELLKIFPSRGSDPLPVHQMEFLTQGAKTGIHIYATSQDFGQVHKQFRLLVNKVYAVKKLVGSPRPMKSRPPINFPWGIFIRQSVKPSSYKGEMAEMQTNFIPIPFLLSMKDIKRYDTLYRVPKANLPDLKLRKQRLYAEDEQGNILYEKIRFKE